MAETSSSTRTLAPVTEEAFIADRMSFWSTFTHTATGTAVALVVLLIAMYVFLV